ncbi:MAG: 5-deoxy-glucuronate isomerase [Paracoccaceae bacterium]|nr:5-deoxy-glucuronate isomerase [Paracoccaceae bacterium]
MKNLLLKPLKTSGLIHDITPKNAGWGFVGMAIHLLKPGDLISGLTQQTEVIIVIVEGKCELNVNDINFGELGERKSVFERLPPQSVYTSINSKWTCQATSFCTIAICVAPGKGTYKTRLLDPPILTQRGKDSNTRFINNIAMEQHDVADSLLVTEVFTPQGNWSSYPPHRHDEDDFPNITYLEETYYHRLNPAQGYATQRVWTEDGSLDETYSIANHDVVLVPRGHHPCGVPYGYELYYLNVMAGPIRKWRFKNHPEHNWIFERDN